ncbi:MAG: hypothetical protein IJS15_10095 [Victivallales bacterium]|nr:hypothetical protein [Victivallales bacterium]
MTNTGWKPEWLLNLCKGKSPGVILIDGDNEKTPCLDFAYEIGATMMELGVAKRLCVWSWQKSLCVGEQFLMGNSAADTHCWTITNEVKNIPLSLKPLEGALMEDSANLNILNPIKRCIHTPADMDAESIEEACEYAGDITIVNHRQGVSLENLAWLNRAVKATGRTFVVIGELADSQGRPYESASYGELALRISVEQGIDLTECAECVVSLREHDYQPQGCRPLRIWNDDRCGDESVIMRDDNGRFIFDMEEKIDGTK